MSDAITAAMLAEKLIAAEAEGWKAGAAARSAQVAEFLDRVTDSEDPDDYDFFTVQRRIAALPLPEPRRKEGSASATTTIDWEALSLDQIKGELAGRLRAAFREFEGRPFTPKLRQELIQRLVQWSRPAFTAARRRRVAAAIAEAHEAMKEFRAVWGNPPGLLAGNLRDDLEERLLMLDEKAADTGFVIRVLQNPTLPTQMQVTWCPTEEWAAAIVADVRVYLATEKR